MAVDNGTKVNNFSLKDNRGNDFNLEDHKGKKVVLSFHPLAWTPVCADQMKSLEENFERFEQLNAVAVGISVDSVPCKNAWAKELKISKTPLLSDFWPHGALARQLGVFREADGFSERANIVLDQEHRVIFVKVYPIKEVPDIEEILKVLEG
jgi:peroxiredoxin